MVMADGPNKRPQNPPLPKGQQQPMNSPKRVQPFRARVFLLRMLAIIFLAEFGALLIAFNKCTDGNMTGREADQTIIERCPSIGSRSQELFAVAIATTLSLLGGSNESPSP